MTITRRNREKRIGFADRDGKHRLDFLVPSHICIPCYDVIQFTSPWFNLTEDRMREREGEGEKMSQSTTKMLDFPPTLIHSPLPRLLYFLIRCVHTASVGNKVTVLQPSAGLPEWASSRPALSQACFLLKG